MNRRYPAYLIALGLLLASFSAAQQTATPQKTPRQAQKQTAREVQKAPAQVKPWKQIPIPPLPAFHPAQPKRVELPNGMVVFLQEDHELPLITATARIRGGARVEPASKVGLIDVYGEVWRTGGTKTRTGDQLDDFLEARAAKVETEGGIDSTSVSLNCLKQDFDDVFNVFIELLRNPEFREDKIDLARKQMNTAIARRNDDIAAVAGRESTMLAYGKNNPYARIPEYATVAAIAREDLLKWHQQYVHPNNILFGVVGDFDANAMEQKLRQAFEGWQKGPQAEPPKIEFAEAKPGLYFVQKDDVNQSAIRMVTLGIRRDNPDYFAVTVMNEMFGGGFSSRLFKNIRTKEGLAYAVGGGVGAAFDHPGIFRLAMGTKIENTVQAIKSLNAQIADLVKEPPTQDELTLAKDSILNSFIFNFDSPEKVLLERMSYEFYGYPADFLERYRAGVEKTTAADVARVAQKYVRPGTFATLVVGTEQAGQQLASLGPVTKLDITIPTLGGTEEGSAAPTTSTPEAKALMSKVIGAMGGEAKVQSVKSVRETASSTIKTPQGEMQMKSESTVVFPDKVHTVLNTPMGAMQMVFTPSAAFMSMGGQLRDIPASQRSEATNSIKRDLLNIAQHVNDPKYAFSLSGVEKVGNVEAQVLEVNADGVSTRLYVDPQTGHVLRQTYSGISQAGPAQMTIDYADWRAIEGLTLPQQKTTAANGEQVSTEKIESQQINPQVDPNLFQKPAASPAS
ncbi:MAG TPA: pitrilysin family protein [Terriglobales bacterium]|nr:pitrilysin family protein [Terriglobales bacterium]